MGMLVELLGVELWEKNVVSPEPIEKWRSDVCSSSCTPL